MSNREGHTPAYATSNYAAYEMRGGGYLLRQVFTQREVFFQPGDDATSIRESVDAVDEVPDDKQDTIFDMIASEYFA